MSAPSVPQGPSASGSVDTVMQETRKFAPPKEFTAKARISTQAQYEQMWNELSALPGVSQVAYGSTIPLRVGGIVLDIKAEGRTLNAGEPQPRSEYRTASPDYFRTSGIPLLRGREFTTTDRAGTERVVVLNKALADRLFPNEDPIGRRVAWTGEVLKFVPFSPDWRTVVGVVGNTKDGGLDAESMPAMFMPFAQEPFPSGGLVIRTRSNAAALAPAATRIVRSIAKDQPIEKVLTVDQIRDESVAPRRLNALLVASFGILAMLVAAVGIAGVLAFSVNARTYEIGIRMSLGADAGRVRKMVLSEGGLLVGVGLALGAVGSLLLARLVRGLLFGVAPHDPLTLAGVTLLMAAIGIGACWLPALRAARIDPGVALRAN